MLHAIETMNEVFLKNDINLPLEDTTTVREEIVCALVHAMPCHIWEFQDCSMH